MSYSSPLVTWDFSASLTATRGESVTLSLAGGATQNSSGLLCDSSGEVASVAAPSALQLTLPITVAFWYTAQGAPQNGVRMFGVAPSDFAFPFRQYSIDIESNKLYWQGNNGGALVSVDTGDAPPSSGTHTVVSVLTTSGLEVYLDGVSIYSDSTSRGSPTYTSPLLYIGGGSSGNSNALFKGAVIDNSAWSSGNVTTFHADPAAYVAVPAESFTLRGTRTQTTLVRGTQATTYLQIDNADGTPATGLTHATSGLVAYGFRVDSGAAAITLAAQTPTGAWTSGGFAEVSSANAPGLYRLDVPSTLTGAGAPAVAVGINGTGLKPTTVVSWLVPDRRVFATLGSSPTKYAFTLSGPSIGAGQLLRRQLQVLSGAATHERVTIVDCAAGGAVVVSPPLTVTPSAGDRVCVL